MMISIIVPVYNVEKYLEQCVKSILTQTYKDFELLLIDDGSTDSSGEICDKYAQQDSRVIVYHKENGGLSSARNVGISKAKGEYTIFVDSDDYWRTPLALNCLLDCAIQNDADIVRGEVCYVDEYGRYLWDNLSVSKDKYSKSVMPSALFIDHIICGKWWVWISLYKSTILQNFNESQKFQEDIEFSIRIFSQNLRCVYVPLAFYAYRIRGGSLVNTIKPSNLYYSFKLCDTFREYADCCQDKNVTPVYRYYSIMMYYWTLCTLAEYFFSQREQIIKDFNLLEKQKMSSLLAAGNIFKYPIPIFLKPNYGCIIIKIYMELKKTFLVIVNKIFK